MRIKNSRGIISDITTSDWEKMKERGDSRHFTIIKSTEPPKEVTEQIKRKVHKKKTT